MKLTFTVVFHLTRLRPRQVSPGLGCSWAAPASQEPRNESFRAASESGLVFLLRTSHTQTL